MATKPTKLQRRACEKLAEALVSITEAARLDGGGRLDDRALMEIAARLANVSTPFGLDEIVVAAIEKRARDLGLPGSAAELLTLMEAGITTLSMLRLDDEELKELVARMEDELGGI